MRLNILLFIIISLNTFSQNLQKLEENNGFRGIKLGSEISNYSAAINAESNSNLFDLYINNNFYNFSNNVNYVLDIRNDKNFESIDNAKILGIYLAVFKGKIREIKVITEYHPYTYELLKLAFGEPNGFGKQWSGDNIYCFYTTPPSDKGKRPDWAWIRFIDKLLDEQFNIEKQEKLKAEKELEQKRAISKF
jgi:hypothetical protein